MAETKRKGDIGEAMIVADALRRGYKVALPVGEDWRYDLIVLRKGVLERVQCKYTESNGEIVEVRCRAMNGRCTFRYSSTSVDWIAVYDKTTDKCYYVPSSLLGAGRATVWLRLTLPRNNQAKRILWAKEFVDW